MREVLKFKLNTEAELPLAFPTGKQCSGIKGEQYLYSLTDGRIAFADQTLDAQIQKLQPKSGARVSVTMRPGNKWEVKLNPPAGQPEVSATPSARQAAQAIQHNDPNTNGNGYHMPDAPYSHTGWAAHLRDQATSLIDVAASCHRYAAEKYPGMLRPEDVSDLLTTVYIGMNQRGGTR